ncbi:MAG: hypothetical protein ACYC3X_10145 [Pirellulaceae bacterium]
MSTAPSRWKNLLLATCLAGLTLSVGSATAQDSAGTPATARLSPQQVQQVVVAHFSDQAKYRPRDLISQSDVADVLKKLAQAGWKPVDQEQILADTLPNDNFLVRLMRTDRGRRFMGKVSDFDLIYDRMDRVSQVSSGPRNLEAIVRLPDGERYAKPKRQLIKGVPDFLDLLAKNASGKVRTIKDYDKPTGRIYTEEELLKRLHRSLQDNASPLPSN